MKENLPLHRFIVSLPVQQFSRVVTIFSTLMLLVIVQVHAGYINVENKSIHVTGKVTGSNNEPLSGVSIREKGTTKGTTTDNNGNFSLTVGDNAVLQVSYIGYTSQEVPVNGQQVLNIKIAPAANQLDQVVVVGYGSQRRRDVTSAISSVNTNDIRTRPVVNTAEVLAGKAAGVQVIQPSGKPGSELAINIRGIASPNGNQPLYVIDGVMTYDTKGLDPGNIESISILKDASAAGIYGAAGSTSGVVLITTRKGAKNRSQVEVNAYTGVQQIVKKLDMLNGQQLAELLVQEKRNAGDNVFTVPSDLLTVNNNWQDIVYHKAMMTGVNAGFSGGSERGTYYLGLGYLNQDGIVRQSNFVRYSINVNLEQNMNSWFSIGTHVGYNRTNSRDVADNARVNQGGVVLAALSTPPFVPKYNPDNTFGLNPFQAWENPLATIEGPYNKTIANNLLGDIHSEIKLPFNLKFRTQLGVTLSNSNYDFFLDPYRTQYGRSKGGIGQNNTSETFRWIWDNTLTYDARLGDHSLNVVLGTSASDQKENYTYEYGEGFPSGSVMTLNNASSNRQLSTTKQEWSLFSYFGRVSYSYQDKYLLTASLRRDGSSRFGPDKRWGWFPAFSAGWRVSNENFMKDIALINDLKIRAGWGETGNIPPVYYPSVAKLSGGNNYIFGGNPIPGVTLSQEIGNPDLKWEEGRQTNVGLDISILKSRISLSADYYLKRTRDLIFQQNVPMSTGLGYRYANVKGIVQNKGFEFSLTGNILNGNDFKWTSTLNMSFNRNIVKGLDSGFVVYGGNIPERDNVTIVQNGLPIGAFWGFIYEGVNPQTGAAIFRDVNKDGVIDALDKTYIGNPIPKFNYGFVNELSFRGFTLNVLIDGNYGNKVFNGTRIETEGMFQVNNASTAVLRRWQKPGDITDIPSAVFADSAQNSRISSRFIENGSFLRFRDITLAYNFANKLISKAGINMLRLYVTLQNYFIITNYKGYQPEVNRDNLNPYSQGIDYGTYPQAKTITVGINLRL